MNKKIDHCTIIFCLICPIFAFWLMQLAMGQMPWQYHPGIIFGNYICFGTVYFLLCALTGKISAMSIILMGAASIWGIANSFLMQFRGNPILPWDFTALETALAVSSNYKYHLNLYMVVTIVLLIGLSILYIKLCHNGKIRWTKSSVGYKLALIMLAVVCFSCAKMPKLLEKCHIEADVWNQAKSYKNTGAMASFILNFKFLKVDVPKNYSKENVEILQNEVIERIESEGEEKASITDRKPNIITSTNQKPHIIAIMNESWADFESYGHLNLSEPVVDYIKSLDNSIYGYAYTSVFGAGTSASEFEFLTGHSMAFLPSGSIPYQQYVVKEKSSMASLLKSQGYQCVAMHPGERTSWQRNTAYPLLGFDAFTCMEDMHVPLSDEHGYVGDDSSFNEIIYQFEHRDQDKPFFMFNVSIQNHGSYTDENYPATVSVLDAPGKYPQAEQYLTLANKTDEAFKILVDYFSKCEEPVLIVMFGDHQPSVETEFLDLAYGVTQDQMNMAQYMGKFKVPYVFWANYKLPDETIENTSLNFLSQYMLDFAGVEKRPYDYFLDSIKNEMPAMTFVGYFDTENTAYSHLQKTDFDALKEKYSILQYEMIFGDGWKEGAK